MAFKAQRCEHCHGLIRGPRKNSDLDTVLAVHEETCPGKRRVANTKKP